MTAKIDKPADFSNLTLMQRARIRLQEKHPELVNKIFQDSQGKNEKTPPPAESAVVEKPEDEKQELNSPLIDLLLSIEKVDRGMIWGVHLGEALGYDVEKRFVTANELLRSLTQDHTAVELEKKRNKKFERAMTIEEFLSHCVKYPMTIRMKDGEIRITKLGKRITEVKYVSRSLFHGEQQIDSALLADFQSNEPAILKSKAFVE